MGSKNESQIDDQNSQQGLKKEEEMREGDIEALRNRVQDEGRPMKSNIIMEKDGKTQTFFETDKKGRVTITEKLKLSREE